MHGVLLALQLMTVSQKWESQGQSQGLQVATHPVEGSSYDAIRVIGISPADPLMQIEEMWGVSTKENQANKSSIGEHKVLAETATHREYYQTVVAPLISERDYVIAFDKKPVGAGYEIRFATVDDPRYPPSKDKVRMSVVGVASVEPRAEGGCTLTYELHNDLKGSLPPWVAKGAQRDAAVEWVKVMVTRAEKRLAVEKKAAQETK